MNSDNSRERFIAWEIASRDTIEVKLCYVDIAGDLVSGVLLSQIVYWHLPNREGKSKLRVQHKGIFWIAKKREAWWDECRITPKQFDRASSVLAKKGLIEVKTFKFNGAPMKHVRLQWDNLNAAIHKLLNIVDFTQRAKSILPKGEYPSSPKVNIHFTQRVKSLTEITTEITTQTTTNRRPVKKIVDDNEIDSLNKVVVGSILGSKKDRHKKTTNPSSTIESESMGSGLVFDFALQDWTVPQRQQATKILNSVPESDKQMVLDEFNSAFAKGTIKQIWRYLSTLVKKFQAGEFVPTSELAEQRVGTPIVKAQNKPSVKKSVGRVSIKDCPYCNERGIIRFVNHGGRFDQGPCSHDPVQIETAAIEKKSHVEVLVGGRFERVPLASQDSDDDVPF